MVAIDDLKWSVQLAKELEAFRRFQEFQTVAELAVAVGKQSGGAYPPALVLAQIGNRVALFAPDLSLALAPCTWLARWRGTQVETRHGLGPGRSWPLDAIKGLGRSLRTAGLANLYSPSVTGPETYQANTRRSA